MDGANIIGEALKQQGVDYMFGVVGIPIMEVAVAAQAAGVNYIGMRNEQAVSNICYTWPTYSLSQDRGLFSVCCAH